MNAAVAADRKDNRLPMAFDSPDFSTRDALQAAFARVRSGSERLAALLSPEDWMLQSMPDASPVKWNLAHTSWFFETFILKPHLAGYDEFHAGFGYLFNSYYNQIGSMHPRAERGLISRPTAEDIRSYRRHVDAAMEKLIETCPQDIERRLADLIALGLAHEEQHQELLLTDLQHAMSLNPLAPQVYAPPPADDAAPSELAWREMEGGLCEFGWAGEGFAFDNEGPRHRAYLEPFLLASRPATNADFIAFIEDGGYAEPRLWLADGWALAQQKGWAAPLYWRRRDGSWFAYTLFGERPIDPHAPLCHVSFFEAAAFAAWSGARLPTEFEWEAAASLQRRLDGRFLDPARPAPPRRAGGEGRLLQLFGDVWEWTASPYVAYPGYAPAAGAIGEYNGKFMSGQMVLRGGSCATPAGHMRLSYRNFFPPQARWQFAGLRLARDLK